MTRPKIFLRPESSGVHSLAHRRHDMLRQTSRALVSAAGRATGAPSTGSLSNNSSAACASQWVQNRTIGKVGVPENYGQIDGVGTSFLGTPVNHREVRRGFFVSFLRPKEGKETGTETRPYHVQRKQRDPRCQVDGEPTSSLIWGCRNQSDSTQHRATTSTVDATRVTEC